MVAACLASHACSGGVGSACTYTPPTMSRTCSGPSPMRNAWPRCRRSSHCLSSTSVRITSTSAASGTVLASVDIASGSTSAGQPQASTGVDDAGICAPERLQSSLRQVWRGEGFDSGTSMPGILAFYRRLGCSEQQLNDAVAAIAPATPTTPTQDAWTKRLQTLSPAPVPAPLQALGSGLGLAPDVSQLQVYGAELVVAAVSALGVSAWQGRPRGWARLDLIEARASQVAGRGLFAKAPIPRRTVLGAYPGRVRSRAEMAAKAEAAPVCRDYVFQTGDGRFLDPTDMSGMPSSDPQPGLPWLPVCVVLAYANEPPKGAGGTNAFVEDGADPSDILFVANRDIQAGEEIFIDYGLTYDRSGYDRSGSYRSGQRERDRAGDRGAA